MAIQMWIDYPDFITLDELLKKAGFRAAKKETEELRRDKRQLGRLIEFIKSSVDNGHLFTKKPGVCIYYGDCPFPTFECQEDEQYYNCAHRIVCKKNMED